MELAEGIRKLCEGWWEEVSDSARGEQRGFAERFLTMHGWSGLEPLSTDEGPAGASTLTYLLQANPGSALSAHFLSPGILRPPAEIVDRGLDFCETTRLLVQLARSKNAHYCLITDLFRSYLYDARAEDLLLHANSPSEFEREFGDVLARIEVAQGALDDLRRQPRSYVARQLREWALRWVEMLSTNMRVSPETAVLAIDRLFVLRFLANHDILRRPGWDYRKRYAELFRGGDNGALAEGCGERLISLFRVIRRDWHAELFAEEPRLDQALSNDAVAGPLLREFGLLSSTRFDRATILESFNYGDAAEKARVRMVPEEDHDRTAVLATQTADTVDDTRLALDLEDEGYRAITYWFDRLVSAYDRLGREFDASAYPATDVSQDMDLFAWSKLDAARPDALTDHFRHATEEGLVVYYASPRQFRTARLLLYLHLIQRYDETKTRFHEFPQVETALQPRPHMLDSDRQQIFGAPRGSDEWNAV